MTYKSPAQIVYVRVSGFFLWPDADSPIVGAHSAETPTVVNGSPGSRAAISQGAVNTDQRMRESASQLQQQDDVLEAEIKAHLHLWLLFRDLL
jgi:hypothetical protein